MKMVSCKVMGTPLKDKIIKCNAGKKKTLDSDLKLERHTAIFLSESRKYREPVICDIPNVRPSYRKRSKFLSYCKSLTCLFCAIFLILSIVYHNKEVHEMKKHVTILKQEVEILSMKSEGLRQNILYLQDRVQELIHKHKVDGYVLKKDDGIEINDKDTVDETNLKIEQLPEHSLLLSENELNSNMAFLNLQNTNINSTNENSESYSVLEELSSVVKIKHSNDSELSNEEKEPGLPSNYDAIMSIPLSQYSSSDLENLTVEVTRVGRTKRSTRRGNKKPPGGRHRLNKKSKNHGPSAVQFKGAVPETVIEDRGLIAPWYADERGAGDFFMSKYQLREGKGAVEVTENGLYYIYAQVYYLTTEPSNSFTINLREEGKPIPEELALCSVNAAAGRTSEVSCFTSVVRVLNATDRIYLHQRERNRRMILRDGFSFLGIVNLNSINAKHVKNPVT